MATKQPTRTDLSEDITVGLCVTMCASDINDIDTRALEKIRDELEGVCGNYGYVSRVRYIDQIEHNPLINCTSGKGEFSLSLTAHITRCLPRLDQEIVCVITGTDKGLGIELSQHDQFIIFILTEKMDTDGCLETTEEQLNVGDTVRVKVMKTELTKGETHPTIIASMVEKI